MMGEEDVFIFWTRGIQLRRRSSVWDNVNAAAMTLAHTTGSKKSTLIVRGQDLVIGGPVVEFVGFAIVRGCFGDPRQDR